VISRGNGSASRQLTFPPFRVSSPRWSPDGQWIAFTGQLPGQGYRVYRIQASGGAPELLTPDDGRFEYPNWLDSKTVLVSYRPYGEDTSSALKLDLRLNRSAPLTELAGFCGHAIPSPEGCQRRLKIPHFAGRKFPTPEASGQSPEAVFPIAPFPSS